MKLLLISCLYLIAIGCTDPVQKINKVYKANDEILLMFGNTSVFRDRDENYVFLYTYSNGKQNQYYFSIDKNKYFFVRDSISFNPDNVLKIKSILYKKEYAQQLEEKLSFYIRKMDSLGIRSFTSEFTKQGVDLKIYMKQGVLIYISDMQNVTNPEWHKYIESMKKIDAHWYYSTDNEISL